MNFQIEKIKTYVGFAIKSKHIVIGTDDILKSKNAKVILSSSNLGDSSKKKLEFYAKKNSCEIFELQSNEINEIINNESIMAFAVTDENLAKAIKNNIN